MPPALRPSARPRVHHEGRLQLPRRRRRRLQKTYDSMMRDAYGNICERMGLEYRTVEADSGQIGGSGYRASSWRWPRPARPSLCTASAAMRPTSRRRRAKPEPKAYRGDVAREGLHPRRPHDRRAGGVSGHATRRLCDEGVRRQGRRRARSGCCSCRATTRSTRSRSSTVIGDLRAADRRGDGRRRPASRARWARWACPRACSVAADISLQRDAQLGGRRQRGRLPLRGRPARPRLPRWMRGRICAWCARAIRARSAGCRCLRCARHRGRSDLPARRQVLPLDGRRHSWTRTARSSYFIMGCYGVGVSRTLAAVGRAAQRRCTASSGRSASRRRTCASSR